MKTSDAKLIKKISCLLEDINLAEIEHQVECGTLEQFIKSWKYEVKTSIVSYVLENETSESNECEYCSGDPMKPLDWQYGLDHIFPDYKYCPMCGRRVQK